MYNKSAISELEHILNVSVNVSDVNKPAMECAIALNKAI